MPPTIDSVVIQGIRMRLAAGSLRGTSRCSGDDDVGIAVYFARINEGTLDGARVEPSNGTREVNVGQRTKGLCT